ncbi:MAG: acylphosphatase [Candidatus Bathyarchaeia archaeon]
MAKIKAEIIVKGKVQKAGYRDYVQEIARSLNVTGYVENLRDGSVKIVCETDKSTLEKFIQSITIKTDLITIEKVEITKTQPAKGEYEYFDIKYGPLEEEMGERLVAAFKMAAATRQDVKNMHQDLKTSITSMHQDLKEGITAMHQDLKGSITSMHQDLKSMHVDLKESINSMHSDMNRHFEEMAKRYDVISAELLKTREELKRAVDNLVEVIRVFIEKSAKV